MNSNLARYWALDPAITYLNHGAFGACPLPVLAAQSELRARLEREPVHFLDAELEPRWEAARSQLAEFLGAEQQDLAFLPNATTGVNTVLRSLEFRPGDEVLTTDHEYNACLNAIRFVAARTGATAVEVPLPFPIDDPGAIVDALLERVTPRTKLAVISHVTSATALVLPIAEIVAALSERGVDTLVDGAHAPGMLPFAIHALGAAYYAGNAHKWLCAPKGAGFLHVRRDRQAGIRPLVISHGANASRNGVSLFRLEFDWLGTIDPSPYLCIGPALDFVGRLLPDGWPGVMHANHALALVGRRIVADATGTLPVAPDEMIGSIAAIELHPELEPRPAPRAPDEPAEATGPADPLHDRLVRDAAIEVPIYSWPPTPGGGRPPHRIIRVSAQLYNDVADYEKLAAALSG